MKKTLFITSIMVNFLFVLFFAGKRYYYSRGSGAGVVQQNTFYDQWNSMRSSMLTSLPVDSADIVFVGNSLTEAFPVTEVFGPDCKNRGIGGNTTAHILNRIRPIAERCPKKIFLEGGINDLNAGVSVDSIFKNYKLIIDAIRQVSPTTKQYAQSVFPTSKGYANLNDSIVKLNYKLYQHCQWSGVTYINVYASLVKGRLLDSAYTEDGIHMNGRGYRAWKRAIEKYVK